MSFRPRLIEDWRSAWRWSSIRFLAAGAAIQGALIATPEKILQYVPDWALSSLAVFSLACTLLAALGRITTTEKPDVHN